MPETVASCELLDWDSQFFGFPVAQERNAVSLRVHDALGFRRMPSELWFHKWYEL